PLPSTSSMTYGPMFGGMGRQLDARARRSPDWESPRVVSGEGRFAGKSMKGYTSPPRGSVQRPALLSVQALLPLSRRFARRYERRTRCPDGSTGGTSVVPAAPTVRPAV